MTSQANVSTVCYSEGNRYSWCHFHDPAQEGLTDDPDRVTCAQCIDLLAMHTVESLGGVAAVHMLRPGDPPLALRTVWRSPENLICGPWGHVPGKARQQYPCTMDAEIVTCAMCLERMAERVERVLE